MKLHLPKVLFAAVVAAVCCVHVARAGTEQKTYTVGEGESAVTYNVTAYTGASNTNIDPNNTTLTTGTILGFEMISDSNNQNYFKNANVTYAGDIYISKGGADADTKTGLVINNGYGNGYTYTFSGEVIGDGDIYKTGNPDNGITLKFTGNMSEYTGAILIEGGSGNNKLIFDGAMTGTGTIQSNGAISMNNTTINNSSITTTGKLTISGNTSVASTLTLGVSSLELGGTLNTDSGTAALTINSGTTIKIAAQDILAGNFSGTVTTNANNVAGHVEGNGYLLVESLRLFSDEDKVTFGGDCNYTVAGASFNNRQLKKITATFSTVYLIENDATYTSAVMGSASLLSIGNEVTLTLQESLPTSVSEGIYIRNANAVINLSGETTALNQSAIDSSADRNVNIKGDGTYKVTTEAIASGVSLDTTWTGTVEYSGTGKSNALTTNLASLGNENSTIKLKGATGHIGTNSGGLSGMTLELVDEGDTKALTIVNGSSKSSESGAISYANSHLAAKLTGSGSIVHNASDLSADYTAFTFEGDISGWTGSFSLTTKNLALRFGGNASVVNASIGKTGGTLDLKVGNDGKKTTFTNTVTVDSITVDAENTMSLGGTTTTTDLTLGDKASLDFSGGTLSVANSITLSTVTVSDLSKYFNAEDLSVELVTVTGTDQSIDGWAGAVTGTYTVDGTNYTTTIDQSGNSIVLTFAAPENADTSFTVEGASLTGNVLTLNIDANLADVSSVDLMLSEAALADIAGMSGLVSLSLVANGGTFTTVETDGATLIENVTFYNGAYSGEGNGMYQIAYIPEPATATLSLLALMGLAARRRRK